MTFQEYIKSCDYDMKWSDTLGCEILWDMLESTTGQFSIVTVYQWSPDESAIFDFGEEESDSSI